MSSALSLVLLVEPDPTTPHRYRSWSPDLPTWYAVGRSEKEAVEAGAEIMRGLVATRPSLMEDLRPTVRAVPVSIDVPQATSGARGVADGPRDEFEGAAAHELRHEPQEQPAPTVRLGRRASDAPRAPIVPPPARWTESPTEAGEAMPPVQGEVAPLRWTPLEAGSKTRSAGRDPWKEVDDPIGDGTLVDSQGADVRAPDVDAPGRSSGYMIRRAPVTGGLLELGGMGKHPRD